MPRLKAKENLVVRRVYESTRNRIDAAAQKADIVPFELIDMAVNFAFKDKEFKAKVIAAAPNFPLRSKSESAQRQRSKNSRPSPAAAQKKVSARKKATAKKSAPAPTPRATSKKRAATKSKKA